MDQRHGAGHGDQHVRPRYDATHRRTYLRAADRALRPFAHSPAHGGVATRWDGRPWYEEYPASSSEHVLNGFEYSLIGLHDLAPRSRVARRLWRAGVRSLAAHIAVFDLPARRTQLYAAVGGGRFGVDAGYRHAHAVATRALARWAHSRILARYAARWAGYERP